MALFIETTDRVCDLCQGANVSTLSTVKDLDSGLNQRKPTPSKQFSHLFNVYAQAFNRAFNRTGCLFETPFERKIVTSEKHLKNLIIYIHQNPVHHGFTEDFKDYPWSSYGSIISIKPTKLCREKVLGYFDDQANFMKIHNKQLDHNTIYNLIIE